MFFISTNIVNGEYAYTSLSVMLWSASIMIMFLNTDFKKYKDVINRMSLMLIPIFALHYMIIYQIVIPLNLFSSYWGQLLGFLAILGITSLIAYVITKFSFMKLFYNI